MDSTKQPATKSKSQVVFFRLSTEEYEAILRASEAAGAKSLSSFARFALLFWLDTHKTDDDIQSLRAKFVDFERAFRHFVRKQSKDENRRCHRGLEQ